MNDQNYSVTSRDQENEFFHAFTKLELGSVLDIIAGFAVSEGAKEAIGGVRPMALIDDIEKRQDEVMESAALKRGGEDLPIGGWEDSRGILEDIKVEGGVVEGETLYRVALGDIKASDIKKALKSKEENLNHLIKYSKQLYPHNELSGRILSIIDEDFEVQDNASEKLRVLRKDINALRVSLRKKFARFAADSGDGEEFVTVRAGRYVISLSRKSASRLKGIVHHESGSGASVFIEPLQLIEDNNRLEGLIQEERKEVYRILRKLSSEVFANRERLINNQDVIEKLDILRASASFCLSFDCLKPVHSTDGTLSLRDARHPLLERQLRREGRGKEVVGLNLDCGPDLRVVVISGPNAGGKTVTLKTVGLIVLLDRCGFPVPVSEGTAIPEYRDVLVDIGDDQSIKKSLSTFSSRVLRMKKILSIAGANSIVLVDEIGDGTSQEEGGAIAEAVLERFIFSGCRVLVTTHLTSLKGWAYEREGALNANLEFDSINLKPLYRLQLGVPGRSWGLETARRLGLDDDIITAAEDRLQSGSQDLEGLLSYLENEKGKLEREVKRVREKQRRLEKMTRDYSERLGEFKKNRKILEAEASEKALRIVTEARAEIENLVGEIKKDKAATESIKKARKLIGARKKRLEKRLREEKASIVPLRPEEAKRGARVRVNSLGKAGRISSVGKGGRVFVLLDGGLKVETKVKDLSPVKEREESGPGKRVRWTASSAGPAETEIMVRGLERAEALEKVDSLLDRAVLQGLESVRIIHGIGKGILREAVYARLKDDPRVKDIHPGEPSIGGDGVAVVELK